MTFTSRFCAFTLLAIFCAVASAQITTRDVADNQERIPTDDPVDALGELLSEHDVRHIIVKLAHTPSEDDRLLLSDSGITLLSPVGAGTYFARAERDAVNAQTLRAADLLVHASRVLGDDKLHRRLAEGQPPAWSIIDDGAAENPTVAAYVLFHSTAIDDVEMHEALGRHNAQLITRFVSVPGVLVHIPTSNIRPLATEDIVQWIEPPLPALEPASARRNDSNRALTGANVVQASPYDLSGAGVTALVYDQGWARPTHIDFLGRLTIIDENSSTQDHSTHVTGTLGSSGASTGGVRRGMAPNVEILAAGFNVPQTGLFLFTNPGDLELDYATGIGLGADVANNSISNNTELNGFPCSYQGDYGVVSSIIDEIVRGSLGNPIITVFAAGNERNGDRCDVEGFGDYYSIAPPAGAKNHLCVGAINSNDESMTDFSSWGPTDDGRIKPEIVAPGCEIGDDNGVTSSGSAADNAITTRCGTSMAAPTVTGLIALLLEDYRAQLGDGLPNPLPSTIKALLTHTASDLGNPGPDYQFGFGSVRIQDAIDHMRSGAFFEREISQGQTATFLMFIPEGTSEFKATLAWDDPAAAPNALSTLVNDLDLIVTGPDGMQRFPWTLDPAAPGAPAVQAMPDRTNNIEQVSVSLPESGVWTIQVTGHDVKAGSQVYSLITPVVPVERGINIVLLDGVPSELPPGDPIPITVDIRRQLDFIISGSETVHYRYNGGDFQTQQLIPFVAGDAPGAITNGYSAVLPEPSCGDLLEYFISVEGSLSGVVTNPFDGSNAPYTVPIGGSVDTLTDDYETNEGWSLSGNAFDGQWERGVPDQPGKLETPRGAPIMDYDGSGQCLLTDNTIGNTDVDLGSTTMTSPVYDISDGGVLSYAYWLNDAPGGEIGDEDELLVEISTDPAATDWTPVRSYKVALGTWRTDSILVGEEIPASATVRVRFTATDNDPGDVIEAAIDSITITEFICSECAVDFNGDGVANGPDVGLFLAAYALGDPDADFNFDGAIDGLDVGAFLAAYALGC